MLFLFEKKSDATISGNVNGDFNRGCEVCLNRMLENLTGVTKKTLAVRIWSGFAVLLRQATGLLVSNA